VSAPPAPPLLLASVSPQRRAILDQLRIPFEVVEPRFEERPGGNPTEHAAGKARSVAELAGDRPVLAVDTVVRCAGRVFGKPASAGEAEEMLDILGGQTHEVVSGLCLLTPGWEETGGS
jgi:septum formation protein